MVSREVRYHRVRVLLTDGWTEWSPTLELEAGLLHATDWTAKAVTLPEDPGREQQSPSPLLRHEFSLDAEIVKARLHVTSLGVHRVFINGEPITDELLNPGWSTYEHRILSATYDVAGLLTEGVNAIGAMLGDGWYRGRLGWDPEGDRANYGSELGLIAQLEVALADGTTARVTTDEKWLAATGEVRSADLYDGCVIDIREQPGDWCRPGFDSRGWCPVKKVDFDPAVLTPRVAPPVRVLAELPPSVLGDHDGEVVYDCAQNISGFVRLHVRGRRGDRITVRHAEVLEPDGTLHTRSLRSARATDEYTLGDDGEVVLEPVFTFHGFRYAGVRREGDVEILSATFVAISSDLKARGAFECSDAALNRLHENVLWSQRDNFVSVPSDCPQRDERLGWTGDAQAFAATAATLFDSESFWRSWLTDLALDQDPILGVSTVVPDVVLDGPSRYGRAGWADAATIVPWAVYEEYGDQGVLQDQFTSMCAWVDSLIERREVTGLLDPEMQFGDWLDPDAPPDRPWEAKADSTYIANCFFSYSARLAADAAAHLRRGDLEERYRTLADDVASLTWEEWQPHVFETQTGCAVALQLGVAPEGARENVAATLARMVAEAAGGVSTGFLGTPLVLPALSSFGFYDEAYLMLLRREYPSWLYQVDRGATTVWERWDAIRPDGTIHPGTMAAAPETGEKEGHMLSFNHYAYGAVIDWVYRHVAGIAPDREDPGYRTIRFAPRPAVGLEWAGASVNTTYGEASISWQVLAPDQMRIELAIPFGCKGVLDPPTGRNSTVLVDGIERPDLMALRPGNHSIVVDQPTLADPGRARPINEGS